MTFFDTHFHFYNDVPGPNYLKEAHQANVTYLMAVGADYEETKLAEELSSLDEKCWFTAGVHPHQASKYVTDISMFQQFLSNPKLCAVGEVGLDYFYENSEKEDQKTVFQSFLNWAQEIDKPVIVHCRDKEDSDQSYQDAYSKLANFANSGGRFVIHCFTGTTDWAQRFLDIGAFIGITGIVTFNRAQNVRDVVEIVPMDRLLLETDSPYLAPIPHRGKKNHPCYLPNVAEKVADVKGLTVEEIADITRQNGLDFFNINL